jgi:GNAT superfamily N-acetyltransferase
MPVTTMSFDNLVEVVSVMADAFHDYPVMNYVLGPSSPGASPYPVRLHRLVQLFVSARAYRREPMLGVRDDRGALIGAATMTLPASSDPPPAFIALRESIWAELGAEPRARYDTYASAANFFADLGPHHHLNMIGVRRSHHGLGVSRDLLAAVHDYAERDVSSTGTSLTTEHAANVKLYEHFGYRVHAHERVSSMLESWGMFRPVSRIGPS